LLDLKDQREGEAHIFFKSRIVRARLFYANPKPVKELRINQFVKVGVPPDSILHALASGFENFKKLLGGVQPFVDIAVSEDDATSIADIYVRQKDSTIPIERGIAALLSFHDRLVGKTVAPVTEAVLPAGELDIFTPIYVSSYLQGLLLIKDVTEFGKQVLDKAMTRDKVAQIEKLAGKSDIAANTVATELIKDIEVGTHYPPEIKAQLSAADLVKVIGDLLQHIVLKKAEAAARKE
jgi:intracellular multiplication protein IcmO